MSLRIGLILATSVVVALTGCGGGSDKPTSVFQKYSGDLKCYNALGTYTETANFAFSEESMTLVSQGTPISLPRTNTNENGSIGYAGPISGSASLAAVVLNPAGTPLHDTTYPVTLALTYPYTSSINPYTFRACK